MRLKIGLMAVALALFAAACGGDDADSAVDGTTTAAPAATTTAPAETTAVPETSAAGSERALTLGATSLGDVLVDDRGGALYLFLPDAQGPSVCYEECAAAWPPLTGEIAVSDGVDAGLLGSVARDDGSLQATYNGWPLYYFANDVAAGDTNGQGLNDVWFVLSPVGDAVR